MMLSITISIFLISLLLALFLTPVVKKFAKRFGVIDTPNPRKIHKEKIPRLGGIAIFISVVATTLIYFGTVSSQIFQSHGTVRVFIATMVGAVFMLTIGILDDTRGMRASRKFLFQILIATVVFALGFRIEYIRFVDGIYFNLGYFSLPFTVLWIVGISNAVNLVDGMDGLASGISLIAFLFIAVIAVLFGNYHVAVVSFAFAGALIGFMRYNFHPASIFMGDSGSLFLGFMLAIFSVQAMRNGHLQFSILIPFLILAIPILDTFLAITRRFVKYYIKNENGDRSLTETVKKILYPDSEHIHHRLLAKGFNQREVSLKLYSMATLGGLFAIGFNFMSENLIIMFFTCLSIGVIKFVDYLNFDDFVIDRRFRLLSSPKVNQEKF